MTVGWDGPGALCHEYLRSYNIVCCVCLCAVGCEPRFPYESHISSYLQPIPCRLAVGGTGRQVRYNQLNGWLNTSHLPSTYCLGSALSCDAAISASSHYPPECLGSYRHPRQFKPRDGIELCQTSFDFKGKTPDSFYSASISIAGPAPRPTNLPGSSPGSEYLKNGVGAGAKRRRCFRCRTWGYTRLQESMHPYPAATPPSSLWSPFVRSR